MPRSFNGLWTQITSWNNLLLAYNNARKGKSMRYDVMSFHQNVEENLYHIHKSLIEMTWTPKPFSSFEIISENKRRFIEAPVFADRIVHHAIVRVLEPIFETKFIFDSYSCRKGKGTHAAVNRVEQFIRTAKAKWKQPYILKCDISKFFPSIDQTILWNILKRTIREKTVLELIQKASIVPGNTTNKGIPIGALTSQLFANVYMNELDHFIKNKLQCRFYLRYADDFVILSENKENLHNILYEISNFLQTKLHLKLNPKTSIFPLSHGLDFCGYRIWATHRLPRKKVIVAAKKRLNKTMKLYAKKKIDLEKAKAVVIAFLGYMQHCNGNVTTKNILKKFILKKEI